MNVDDPADSVVEPAPNAVEAVTNEFSVKIQGEPVTRLPQDLYIPPDALEVFLESFEGPLDLLLYLIRRQNLDILDIPIAEITRQYIEYIALMREMRFELAAEYLVMAAVLAEIKSRMLLPRPESVDEDEDEDPRAELVRRLQEYERYKQAAEDLDELPRIGRDIHQAVAEVVDVEVVRKLPQVHLEEMLDALRGVLERAEQFAHHHIAREPLSVRERMSRVLVSLQGGGFCEFTALFDPREGRAGVVVTLLAILELVRGALVQVTQTDTYGVIYLRAADS